MADRSSAGGWDVIITPGGITEHHHGQATIRLVRRTYSPILRQASPPGYRSGCLRLR